MLPPFGLAVTRGAPRSSCSAARGNGRRVESPVLQDEGTTVRVYSDSSTPSTWKTGMRTIDDFSSATPPPSRSDYDVQRCRLGVVPPGAGPPGGPRLPRHLCIRSFPRAKSQVPGPADHAPAAHLFVSPTACCWRGLKHREQIEGDAWPSQPWSTRFWDAYAAWHGTARTLPYLVPGNSIPGKELGKARR